MSAIKGNAAAVVVLELKPFRVRRGKYCPSRAVPVPAAKNDCMESKNELFWGCERQQREMAAAVANILDKNRAHTSADVLKQAGRGMDLIVVGEINFENEVL